MSSGWVILIGFSCILALLVGFFFRMGYEFKLIRSVLTRARYISVYNVEISLEAGFWKLTRKNGTVSMSLSSSYPKLQSVIPLELSIDAVSIVYSDVSPGRFVSDYSSFGFKLPSVNTRVSLILRRIFTFLRPRVSVRQLRGEYGYHSSRLDAMQHYEAEMSDVKLDSSKCIATSSSGRMRILEGDDKTDERVHVTLDGPCECRLRAMEELDFSADSIDVKYLAGDSLRSVLEASETTSTPSIIPSNHRIKTTLSIRSRFSSSITFRDKMVIHSSLITSNRSGTSRRYSGVVSGLFTSLVLDPFSGSVFKGSVHNFSEAGSGGGIRSFTVQVLIRGVTLGSLVCTGVDIVASGSADGDWSLSARSQKVGLILLDKSNSSTSNLMILKSASVSGTPSKGLTVSIMHADFDLSSRSLGKAVRVYSRLMSLVEKREEQISLIPTGAKNLLQPSDPSFLFLQRKYLSLGSQTPPLVNDSSVSTVPTPALSEAMSRSTSAMSEGHEKRSRVKNWKAMERILFDRGNVLVNWSVDELSIRNKELIRVKVPKLRLTSKISSTGSPFMTVCCDGFSVNDNIVMNGGMRIWVDGQLSSEMSRVFCLIPPVSIRFETKFAEVVETYCLELVEVLKLLNTRNPLSQTGATTTKQFIEFLQISSLQLELHAKEMLGVLALDKATINLSRSSVYKSNGVVDAINSLVTQYREEVIGQWFSLLTRLDVSIGRPVSTARRILADLFTRSETPSQS